MLKYNIDDTIANILKAFTSMLIVPDLNNSITVGSNKPYTKTRPNTKDWATKYRIKPNNTEKAIMPLFLLYPKIIPKNPH